LNKVELESFLKSFILFFGSLTLLIATLFYINYTKEVQTLNETLFSQMRVCSFDLKCEQFKIDFVEKKEQKLYTLYSDKDGLTSYYPIPNSQIYYMLINFAPKLYTQELQKLQKTALWNFLAILVVVLILSTLFSIYALYPLRNALLLTQEFIKDILHDFNTPLASLRLNSSMLKKEIGENSKVERIEQSVKSVLDLQEHLRSYLHNHALQKEEFDLKELLQERVAILEKTYPTLDFRLEMQSRKLFVNRELLTRVLDNLLINAAKYNKKNGFIEIHYHPKTSALEIKDSGVGIKNTKKIFQRFYKEQERGIGIGLHIVKKLCDEAGIKISVQSRLGEGSLFILSLDALTLD